MLPLEGLKSAELTGRWEMRLESIANGTENVAQFILQMQAQTTQWCREIGVDVGVAANSSSGLICPACGAQVVESAYGYRCSNLSGCKFVIGKTVCGAPLSRENARLLCETKKSGLIRGMTSKKTASTVNAFLMVGPDGNVSFDYNSGMKCPKCGGEVRPDRFGYSCANWKSGCKASVPFVLCGHVMTEAEINALFSGDKTDIITDFQKKGASGNHFSAALSLGKEGKLEFLFPPQKNR